MRLIIYTLMRHGTRMPHFTPFMPITLVWLMLMIRISARLFFTTQSTHKLLAAFSQASMIHVKQGARSKVDPNRFNEAFMMHTSTSPHYGVIASCDVASKMMSGKSGPSLIEDIHSEAMAFRHSMANVGHGQQSGWWFDVWQPDAISAKSNDAPQAPQAADWVLRPGDKWHGFEDLADDYVLIDPIKVTLSHARAFYRWLIWQKKVFLRRLFLNFCGNAALW